MPTRFIHDKMANQSMRFALIVTNLAGGGAEKALLNLGAALVRHGHRVHMVLLEEKRDHVVPAEVTLSVLSRPGKRLSKGWWGRRYAAWLLRRHFQRLAKEDPFDLVISTLPFADEVTIRAGIPRHWCRIANTLSAEVAKLAQQNPRKALRRLHRYRRLYGSRPLIAVSEGVAEDLRGALGLTSVRIEHIYNAFDFAAMRALSREPVPGLPAEPFVLHIGRFNPQKRHDLLLAAWQRVTSHHKLLLMTQPNPLLQALIAGQGLADRVQIIGFQSNPYPWIAAADLLVLCSDHEGMPNVLVESLVCGTPVVATDCPSGPREILGRDLPEALVPMNNPMALAQKVEQFLHRPPDLEQVNLSAYSSQIAVLSHEKLAMTETMRI
ncbi:MAG: glycosyltransferase [Magnetococcus sp. DMHC-1]|nr:glycosyltransferase [Magnetococcales bacterium]